MITTLFGWDDDHLHILTVGRHHYADPFHGLEETVAEHTMRLYQALRHPKATIFHTYDLGAGWKHEILLEKVLCDHPLQHPHLDVVFANRSATCRSPVGTRRRWRCRGSARRSRPAAEVAVAHTEERGHECSHASTKHTIPATLPTPHCQVSTLVWADGGYAGKLVIWANAAHKIVVQIVKRTASQGGKSTGSARHSMP